METITEIAALIKAGHRGRVHNDDHAYYESGDAVEGSWYIAIGEYSYCYYRTREDARRILREARRGNR